MSSSKRFVSLWLAIVTATASNIFSIQMIHAQCTDVHVVFARGSGEMQGFGICGQPFVQTITTALAPLTVSSYAVQYMADVAQTSAGPGATDMTSRVVKVAQACPNTVFVLGGYSQGATVTDIAIGIRTGLGSGQSIPTSLAPRIKAVVTFGNPLKLTGGTIASQSQLYGNKAIEICNTGDPVCAGGFNFMAHTMYPTDGGVAKAAQKAAQMVRASGGSGGTSAGQRQPEGRDNNDDGLGTTSTGTGAGGNGAGFPGLGGGGGMPSFGFGSLLRGGQ